MVKIVEATSVVQQKRQSHVLFEAPEPLDVAKALEQVEGSAAQKPKVVEPTTDVPRTQVEDCPINASYSCLVNHFVASL